MSGPPPAKRKKGLSLDEKREVMMSILHETKEVYNLKVRAQCPLHRSARAARRASLARSTSLPALQDLEKLGSKAGVVLQTVQEVVKSLCDDRLVETDKIGSGNFFWSFPSKALVAKKTRLETLESSLAAEEKAIADMEARLAALSAGREDSASRTKDLAELGALRVQKAELEAAVKAYGDSDPEALKEMQKKVGVGGRRQWRRQWRGQWRGQWEVGCRAGGCARVGAYAPQPRQCTAPPLPAGTGCKEIRRSVRIVSCLRCGSARPVRSAARDSTSCTHCAPFRQRVPESTVRSLCVLFCCSPAPACALWCRWTDNVWVLKEHLVTKYGKMPGEVDQMMGIPDDFDYLS